MNDNEIIKALECCSSQVGCDKCGYFTGKAGCMVFMATDALDLINRQRAEIEALIAGQETLQKYIAEQQVEIEILTGERDCFAKMEHDNLYEQTQKIRKAKTKAIKEFAERLKEKSILISKGRLNSEKPMNYELDMEYRISMWDFDTLVKEMVGDAE